MMKIKEITELVSLRTLQKIQEHYSIALGLPLTIRNKGGELLIKPYHHSKLWQLIQKTPSMAMRLLQSNLEGFKKCERTGQVIILERIPDTHAFFAPIIMHGQALAFFIGGMVRFGNPNIENASTVANELGVDLDTYLDAYLSLPLLTQERMEAAGNLIKVIGQTISTLELVGNDLQLKKENYEKANKELSKNLAETSTQLDISKNRYQLIFESVDDGIYVSKNGKFVDINQAGAKLLGFDTPSEVIGIDTASVYVYPEDRDRYDSIIKRKGFIKNWIAHIKTPSGDEKFLETNAIAVKDKKGEISHFQGIFRDINHRQQRTI